MSVLNRLEKSINNCLQNGKLHRASSFMAYKSWIMYYYEDIFQDKILEDQIQKLGRLRFPTINIDFCDDKTIFF